MKDMLTIPEAAKYIGDSEYGVRMAIRRGRFPYNIIRNRYMLQRAVIDRCLEAEALENQQKAREQWTNDLTR